jgi:hypothetical protein
MTLSTISTANIAENTMLLISTITVSPSGWKIQEEHLLHSTTELQDEFCALGCKAAVADGSKAQCCLLNIRP